MGPGWNEGFKSPPIDAPCLRMNPRAHKYHEQGWRRGRDAGADARSNAHLFRQSLSEALHLPEDEAVRRVVADYERRLDALPPLSEYPELKGMRECVAAYNDGMAEGAGVTLEDVILSANYRHAITVGLGRKPQTTVPTLAGAPGCTLVYFPRSDRGPLVANNNDGTIRWAHTNQPDWIVANRAGIMVGTVSSGVFDDEVSPQQFPAPVFLMVNEMCGTTSEAVDLLTRLNLFWEPCNTLIADRHGDSTIIEKSACRYGARKSADGFSATTEMSAEEPVYKAYLWETRERSLRARGLNQDSADWAYWKACERRSARLLKMTEEASEAPTYEKMEQIIYNHTGSPDQIHMDGSKCHPDQEAGEWSIRTVIWVVHEQAAQYSFAEPPMSGHLTKRHWKKYGQIEMVF